MSEEKYNFTIPANSSVEVNATGNRVYCEAATDRFFINVPGVQSYEMKAKRTRVLSQSLKTFTLENRTAAPNTIELHIGYEEVQDNEVHISGSISGNVQVVNPAGQKLAVEDVQLAAANTALTNIRSSTYDTAWHLAHMMFQIGSGREIKTPLTTLFQTAYVSVANANSVIVPAASNPRGIIIRRAYSFSETTSAAYGSILVDGNKLAAVSNQQAPLTLEDYYIPSGKELRIESTNAYFQINMFYQVM